MPFVVIIVLVVIVAVGGFFISRDTTSENVATTDAVVAENTQETTETAIAEVPEDTAVPPDSAQDENDPAVSQMVDTPATEPTTNSVYANGTYETVTSYFTPSNVEHEIAVSLTLVDGAVTAAEVQYDGADAETPNHVRFENAWEPEVIGVAIDEVALSRTGGASLTTEAFNEAIETIKQNASV